VDEECIEQRDREENDEPHAVAADHPKRGDPERKEQRREAGAGNQYETRAAPTENDAIPQPMRTASASKRG
jgi:hypothetical protein